MRSYGLLIITTLLLAAATGCAGEPTPDDELGEEALAAGGQPEDDGNGGCPQESGGGSDCVNNIHGSFIEADFAAAPMCPAGGATCRCPAGPYSGGPYDPPCPAAGTGGSASSLASGAGSPTGAAGDGSSELIIGYYCMPLGVFLPRLFWWRWWPWRWGWYCGLHTHLLQRWFCLDRYGFLRLKGDPRCVRDLQLWYF